MNIQKKLININFSTAANQKLGICIHTMVGTLAGTDSWFRNPDAKASSHYGVDLKTDTVYQWVEEKHQAWAQGRVSGATNQLYLEKGGNPNGYFISIECADGRDPAGADRTLQERTVAELVSVIAKRNNIPLDSKHICGHREIYNKKTCPGNLDVNKIINLAKELNPEPTPPNMDDKKLADEMRKILAYNPEWTNVAAIRKDITKRDDAIGEKDIKIKQLELDNAATVTKSKADLEKARIDYEKALADYKEVCQKDTIILLEAHKKEIEELKKQILNPPTPSKPRTGTLKKLVDILDAAFGYTGK